jgi:hypothetical protein
VPIGQVIDGSFGGLSDTVHRYAFPASAGQEYAVFLEAVDGAVGVSVIDSITGVLVATANDAAGAPGLDQVATENVSRSSDGVFLILVHRFTPATTRQYRFRVYLVNLAPESHPTRFVIGDTVSGESADPIVDVDEFIAAGQAGQEIAGVLYGLTAASTPRGLSLSVKHPATGNVIASSVATTGPFPISTTTGRITLPVTGDYHFVVRAISSGSRYGGPYTFRFHAINRAPEQGGSAIVPNTTIGERIDEFGDIDEFALTNTPDADFNVFMQSSAQLQTQLDVTPPGGSPLQTVPTDTGLFQHATGRFHVEQGGTLSLRASSFYDRQIADTGSYRIYVYQVNPLPEHIASTIAPGDTIAGESIDLPGDVDEFSFTAVAGAEFNVLFQPQGAIGALLRAEVVGPAGTIASVGGNAPVSDLFQLVTGRFMTSTAGTYRIRVTGAVSTTPQDTGQYRLFLYQVDRHPESLPQELAPGDSISGEAIDLPGDIDEFTVTVPDSIGAAVELQIETAPGIGDWARATVFPSSGDSLGYVDVNTVGEQRSVERLRLGPGTYTIRVEGVNSNQRSLVRTRYQLWMYRFVFTPEIAADTFAIGDTVSGEALNVPGDVDAFHFYGTRGELVNIALQGMSAPTNTSFQLWLIGPGTDANPFLFVQSPTAAAALGDYQTTRLDLPFTGWYRIEIKGSSIGGNRQETGPYRFTVESLDAGPEHVSAELVPGDSVTTESIDALGDWDQFRVTASPGDEIAVVFSATPSNQSFASALVFDSATGDQFFELSGAGGTWQTGPVPVPVSGHLALAVREGAYTGRFCIDATCGGLFHFVGPYRLSVVRVNRAPENAPAAYTLSDTVRAESIAPIGDIDEFTGSGAPGAVLSVFYRMAAATAPPDGSIQLQVIDPATQAVLVGDGYAAVNTSFFTPGSFTVPASGNFLVRIRAYPATSVTTVPYEFFIRP